MLLANYQDGIMVFHSRVFLKKDITLFSAGMLNLS